MEQWIGKILLGILMIFSTGVDVKKREISVRGLVLFGIMGSVIYYILKPFTIWSFMGGIGIGLILLTVSGLTKGSIGMGDGGLLCVSGMYLGFLDNLVLLFTGLLLAAVWSVFLILLKKAGKKTEIPFVPFLMTAYIGMILL